MSRVTELLLLGAAVIIVSILIVFAFSLTQSGQMILDSSTKSVNQAKKEMNDSGFQSYSGKNLIGAEIISLIHNVWEANKYLGETESYGIFVATLDKYWTLYDYHGNTKLYLQNADENNPVIKNFPESDKNGNKYAAIYDDRLASDLQCHVLTKDSKLTNHKTSESLITGYRNSTRPNEPGFVKATAKFNVTVLCDTGESTKLIVCTEN